MTQVLDDSLAPGREAAARGAWRQAYDLLKPSEGEITDPTDLEIYAEATWWSGMLDKAIALRERAFAAYTEAGENRRAAVVALQISSDYFGKAQLAPSAGWFGKAERLLDGQEESPEHGYLAVTQSFGALMSGDFEAGIGKADLAYAIGQRFGDRDLQALGLTSKGRALVLRGEVDEGLRLLDEATAAAVSGELRPFSTGLIYCVTITSCNNLGDYRRGSEWTEAANKWCERQDLKGFPGACRVHHSTALRLKGDWDAAEEQAVEACEELRGFDAWTTAVGFYEIGEIRRRRGDFAAAEEAYKQAKEWGRDPQPGLALLRLAQGKVDAAAAGVKRSLAAAEDEIGRFRRLPAQVEIALATGDLETARKAATELGEIADKYMIDGKRTPAFEAEVCLAWARILLEDGAPEEAAAQAQHALDEWRSVHAPYETAEAQVLLAMALRREGDEDGALDELAAARATFERLGAVLAAQRAAELSGEVPAHADVHVHGHRRLDEPGRGTRRDEVAEAPRLARPDAPRAPRRPGRRGHQADRRRVLRRVRRRDGGGRGRGRRAARARGLRGHRPGRPHRPPLRRRVLHGRRRLRRPGRARGRADRRARRGRRDPREPGHAGRRGRPVLALGGARGRSSRGSRSRCPSSPSRWR